MEKAGLDPRSIDYLIRLERGTVEAVIVNMSQLTKIATWEGRVCKVLVTGLELVFTDGKWRAIRPENK